VVKSNTFQTAPGAMTRLKAMPFRRECRNGVVKSYAVIATTIHLREYGYGGQGGHNGVIKTVSCYRASLCTSSLKGLAFSDYYA
jgi:hypothetical protein